MIKIDPIFKIAGVIVVLYLMTVAILFLTKTIDQPQLINGSIKFFVTVTIFTVGSFLIKIMVFRGSNTNQN